MRYVIVDPRVRLVQAIDCATITAARALIGLSGVDHGIVRRSHDGGIAIVVAEFGLYDPPERQAYFALARRLYAGPAVLYGFNAGGETIDLVEFADPVHWFSDQGTIEAAIAAGTIVRPVIRIGGKLLWQWPEPRPEFLGRAP